MYTNYFGKRCGSPIAASRTKKLQPYERQKSSSVKPSTRGVNGVDLVGQNGEDKFLKKMLRIPDPSPGIKNKKKTKKNSA